MTFGCRQRGQSLFIIALAMLGVTARAYCYNAEVIDISGTKYFPAVKEALSKAEKSIYVAMFTIESSHAKARKYAEIVFAENNPEVIEDIILKTKEYGEKEVKRAFGEIARKNIDNPKRNYVYVTRILGKTTDAKP